MRKIKIQVKIYTKIRVFFFFSRETPAEHQETLGFSEVFREFQHWVMGQFWEILGVFFSSRLQRFQVEWAITKTEAKSKISIKMVANSAEIRDSENSMWLRWGESTPGEATIVERYLFTRVGWMHMCGSGNLKQALWLGRYGNGRRIHPSMWAQS